jgi:hypothetical protein
MIMNIPAEAGIQNPHCISPFAKVNIITFAKGETKRGSIPGRASYRQLARNDDRIIQRISGTPH